MWNDRYAGDFPYFILLKEQSSGTTIYLVRGREDDLQLGSMVARDAKNRTSKVVVFGLLRRLLEVTLNLSEPEFSHGFLYSQGHLTSFIPVA